MRIVSLVPSLTEFLYDLGLDQEVVGITKFCVHPNTWFRTKTRVGGTKTPKIDRIRELQPHWVICNKEENRKEDVEALSTFTQVLVTDINTWPEMESELLRLAATLDRINEAQTLLAGNNNWLPQQASALGKRAAYLIWKDPYMAVGSQTFIHDTLTHLGLDNVIHTALGHARYPEVDLEALQELNLDLLMLSSEPYPFSQKHLLHFQEKLPSTKIRIVDGELFSWYGSRMKFLPSHWRALNL